MSNTLRYSTKSYKKELESNQTKDKRPKEMSKRMRQFIQDYKEKWDERKDIQPNQ